MKVFGQRSAFVPAKLNKRGSLFRIHGFGS